MSCQNLPGVLPFSTNEFGVDIATGNVNIAIPLRSKNGKIPFWSKIVGTSGIATDASSGQWKPMLTWTYQDPTTAKFTYTVAPPSGKCANGPTAFYYYEQVQRFGVTDSTGASHPFPLATTWKVGNGPAGTSCATQQGTIGPIQTTDGSGYILFINNGNITVYDRNGNYWGGQCDYYNGCVLGSPSAGSFSDLDGANISENNGTVTDTLATTVLTGIPNKGLIPRNPISYADTNGNTQQYSFGYTNLSFASPCGGSVTYGPTSMLTSVTQPGPDPAQYIISYEPTPGVAGYSTGRISKITLPSGGSISYAYSGGTNGLNCSSNTVPTLTVTVDDNNGKVGTYTYVSSLGTIPNSSGGITGINFTVTKTDSVGNQTVYYFNGEYQTQVQYYQGTATGTPLKTVVTCYNGNTTNCQAPSSNPVLPITQTNEYTSFGSSASNLVQTIYDSNGNVSSEVDMDYGNVGNNGQCKSSTAGVCRQTTTIYGSWNGSNCIALSTAPSIPCDVKITNNNTGTVLAETRYTYNSSGHPTAISKWVTGSKWFTVANQFNSTGTLSSTTDPKGNTTQYGYAASGSGGCNGLLPTSTTYALSSAGSSSQMWNCAGGVLSSSTDANGKTISYEYADPQWRLTNTNYPDGGSIATQYNTGASLPWNTSTNMAINATANKNQVTQYDGLGRNVEIQSSDPSGTDTVDTSYDTEGRIYTVSNPYRSTPSSTDGTTTNYYDALGRPIKTVEQNGDVLQWCYNNISSVPAVVHCTSHLGGISAGVWVDFTDEAGNHWQRSTDSLGRLTEVMEPDSSNNPTLETDYQYDVLNNLLQVDQWGGPNGSSSDHMRTFIYDGMSRLVTAANPESGTISYTYDANGNVWTKTDARGVITTYSYDAMNRLTSKTYSSDPSKTASACFQYDQSPVPSSGGNLIGRLTNGWTQSASAGACAVALPDTGYLTRRSILSYDAMGRVTNEQQCTPLNCNTTTPYALTSSYDFAGNVSQYTNGIGSIMLTPTYDGANRLSSITSSWVDATHPSSLFSSPAYFPPGQLQNWTQGTTSSGTPALSITQGYTNRLWLNSISATGQTH